MAMGTWEKDEAGVGGGGGRADEGECGCSNEVIKKGFSGKVTFLQKHRAEEIYGKEHSRQRKQQVPRPRGGCNARDA